MHSRRNNGNTPAHGDPLLVEELRGISEGSGLSPEGLVVLNNYTDFRDISLPDEGCSVVFVDRGHGSIAGQTWDMHASAKNYVCCLRLPSATNQGHAAVVFSLVGCVGMMGFTSAGTMVGVNNINTDGARAGVLWPVLVRRLLRCSSVEAMTQHLITAPVTSGHNYLLASRERSEMWEVLPEQSRNVGTWEKGREDALFHTNHCLDAETQARETPSSVNSTTHDRYALLEKKIGNVKTYDDTVALLNDHENYPKSICSNFQAKRSGSFGHVRWGSGRLGYGAGLPVARRPGI